MQNDSSVGGRIWAEVWTPAPAHGSGVLWPLAHMGRSETRYVQQPTVCMLDNQRHCPPAVNVVAYLLLPCVVCIQVVAGVCHSIVYGLMCFVVDQFHAETLGSDVQVLPSVISAAFISSAWTL